MPESHLRAADADRAAVAEVLGTHMSAGRLTVAEFDDRLSRAYAARTYGELDQLTADLPAVEQPPVVRPEPAPTAQPVAAGCGGPGTAHWAGDWGHWGSTANGLRAAWASWLTTAVIVVGIWVLTSLGTGDWIYPWPVWVIGPWGVVLLAQTLGGARGPGRDRQRDRRPGRLPG
ncbi:DUF1707 SHOCT-like domain-containing protein [Modestobacter altitudinis]|uniref:DUF1707 SHOCT-like domain-containing protein n=1 Tax=Modestobacter altitudinis TaxID=2213158 RepID=UPI00110CA6E4|nr:DUF1707 domain-containing protein [Modestobacter altitudinis]